MKHYINNAQYHHCLHHLTLAERANYDRSCGRAPPRPPPLVTVTVAPITTPTPVAPAAAAAPATSSATLTARAHAAVQRARELQEAAQRSLDLARRLFEEAAAANRA
jgi:hypothetical protein